MTDSAGLARVPRTRATTTKWRCWSWCRAWRGWWGTRLACLLNRLRRTVIPMLLAWLRGTSLCILLYIISSKAIFYTKKSVIYLYMHIFSFLSISLILLIVLLNRCFFILWLITWGDTCIEYKFCPNISIKNCIEWVILFIINGWVYQYIVHCFFPYYPCDY